MEDASWEKAKRCRAACGTRAILYTSSAGGRNVNGLDVCYACKIRCNKLSNRSQLAFKCLLTALETNEILRRCRSSDVRCGAGAPEALCPVSLLSPPTFRSRSLLSVIIPHCPRQRARHVVNCVLLLAFMSALGTAASHSIRTTFASRHRPRRSGDPGDISQLVSKRNACVREGHVHSGVQQVQQQLTA